MKVEIIHHDDAKSDKAPFEILVYGQPIRTTDGNVFITSNEEMADFYSKGGVLYIEMIIPNK